MAKGSVGGTAKGMKPTNAALSSESSLWAMGAYSLHGTLGNGTTQLSEFSHQQEGVGNLNMNAVMVHFTCQRGWARVPRCWVINQSKCLYERIFLFLDMINI